MKEDNLLYKEEYNDSQIDILGLIWKFWGERKLIIYISIIGLIIGVFLAVFTPKHYTVTSVIVPQYSGKTTGSNLSALASMAGINIGSSDNSGEISPLLYPQIVQSVPFQLELMNTPVHFQDVDHPVSVYEYYTEHYKPGILTSVKKYTVGLPGIIMSIIKPGKETNKTIAGCNGLNLLRLTDKQNGVYQILSTAVTLNANAKEGYLTLSTTMQEPLVAAELGQIAQTLLQQFVIDFKTQKSKKELEFIQERYNATKIEMERKQYNAAASTDKNKFLTTTTAQLGTTRANTNYQISNAVFLELAKQLEQAKIQVKKDTPTFTVVKPVIIPNEPNGKGSVFIVVITFFLFFVLSLIIIFIKFKMPEIKESFNKYT